jgi:hypothetical protein
MIGDSAADLRAGAAAGVTTVRVETGEPARAGDPSADYVFANVLDAARFITGPFAAFAAWLDAQLNTTPAGAPLVITGTDARARERVARLVATRLRQRRDNRAISVSLTHGGSGSNTHPGCQPLVIDIDSDAAVQHILTEVNEKSTVS